MFTAEFAGERILKIGKRLAKLLFFDWRGSGVSHLKTV